MSHSFNCCHATSIIFFGFLFVPAACAFCAPGSCSGHSSRSHTASSPGRFASRTPAAERSSALRCARRRRLQMVCMRWWRSARQACSCFDAVDLQYYVLSQGKSNVM